MTKSEHGLLRNFIMTGLKPVVLSVTELAGGPLKGVTLIEKMMVKVRVMRPIRT